MASVGILQDFPPSPPNDLPCPTTKEVAMPWELTPRQQRPPRPYRPRPPTPRVSRPPKPERPPKPPETLNWKQVWRD
jgi:hypothetical protein